MIKELIRQFQKLLIKLELTLIISTFKINKKFDRFDIKKIDDLVVKDKDLKKCYDILKKSTRGSLRKAISRVTDPITLDKNPQIQCIKIRKVFCLVVSGTLSIL